MTFRYPEARRDLNQVDDYHGTKIPDPYAWLEDPDSPETMTFVEEQNQLTMPYLEGCAVRARFQQRLTELYDYPKFSCPYKRGSRYTAAGPDRIWTRVWIWTGSWTGSWTRSGSGPDLDRVLDRVHTDSFGLTRS